MASILSVLSNVFVPQTTQVTTPVQTPTNNNPFNNNPFVNYKGNAINSYGKNAPVKGGYFAGYYNGKQNIVGQRLFIEV